MCVRHISYFLQRKDRQYAPPVYDSVDDFEPRIITDPELKPKIEFDAEKNKKKVVRTRYISTELGIRERLVCAVLTTPSSFHSLGMCIPIYVKLYQFSSAWKCNACNIYNIHKTRNQC